MGSASSAHGRDRRSRPLFALPACPVRPCVTAVCREVLLVERALGFCVISRSRLAVSRSSTPGRSSLHERRPDYELGGRRKRSRGPLREGFRDRGTKGPIDGAAEARQEIWGADSAGSRHGSGCEWA